MAHIHTLNAIGSATAPLSNWTMRQPWMRWGLEKLAGIDRRRTLPSFSRTSFRSWFRGHAINRRAGERGSVVLLDDCFTTYNAPEVGQAAVQVLEAAGFSVNLAGVGCCGRPAFSKGLLPMARDLARANLAKLLPIAQRGTPILGIEPSCLTMFVDEYRDLKLGKPANLVAARSMMVDSFLAEAGDLPLRSGTGRVLLHGHCQQKALMGTSGDDGRAR